MYEQKNINLCYIIIAALSQEYTHTSGIEEEIKFYVGVIGGTTSILPKISLRSFRERLRSLPNLLLFIEAKLCTH
jgi:hypothetical protein